jgi:hypothetical protein
VAVLHDSRSHASVLAAAVQIVAASPAERGFRFFERLPLRYPKSGGNNG